MASESSRTRFISWPNWALCEIAATRTEPRRLNPIATRSAPAIDGEAGDEGPRRGHEAIMLERRGEKVEDRLQPIETARGRVAVEAPQALADESYAPLQLAHRRLEVGGHTRGERNRNRAGKLVAGKQRIGE